MHAALCWILHPEEASVSTGIDIASYLVGGYDAPVLAQRNRAPRSGTSRSTHRVATVCCLASAVAFGTGLSSCASGPDKHGKVVFKEVPRAQLKTAAGDIARTLLGFLVLSFVLYAARGRAYSGSS